MVRFVNQAGQNLIKRYESCRLAAYRDGGGILTIGWGHTFRAGLPFVKEGMIITQAAADVIFAADVNQFASGVEKLLARPATDNQFAALVSLAYNIGMPQFDNSTVLRRFNMGSLTGAAEALKWFVKDDGKVLAGLIKRREDEAALFLTPDPAASPVATEEKGFTMGSILSLAWPVIMGQVRTGLAALAGGLVTQGYLTSDQSTQVVGGAVALLAAVWSGVSKYLAAKKAK